MLRPFSEKMLLFCIALMLFPPLVVLSQSAEEKHLESHSTTGLLVEVKDKDSGEPVNGAEVYLRSETADKGFESSVKTNMEGMVSLVGVPLSKMLIQVTARECQNFGGWFDLKTLAKPDSDPDDAGRGDMLKILIALEKEIAQ